MSVTTEQQRKEAIARLRILNEMGLIDDVVNQFESDGKVHYSDRFSAFGAPVGALFWIDQDTSCSRAGVPFGKVISNFEAKFNALVYHATHEFFPFGECLDLFYVSQYEEEWERDRAELAQGFQCVCASNLDDPVCTDIGVIRFKVAGGGLIRLA